MMVGIACWKRRSAGSRRRWWTVVVTIGRNRKGRSRRCAIIVTTIGSREGSRFLSIIPRRKSWSGVVSWIAGGAVGVEALFC
jgi:hypothetical protein